MSTVLIDGDVLFHVAIWKTGTVEEFSEKLFETIEDWKNGCFSEDVIIGVESRDGWNFREALHPLYKKTATREAARAKAPAHKKDCKALLYSLPEVSVAEGIETDDLLGIWSNQLGDNCVIATLDKDLDQVAGLHYNPYYKRPVLKDISKQKAKEFLTYQLLAGDPVDNILGVPGLGPVKAKALIESFEGKLFDGVVKVYQDKFLLDWENSLLMNGKLVYILRDYNQPFSIPLLETLLNETQDT